MFAVALLVVVAAAAGAVPGTRQAVWQFADRALQLIMQLVTVEVCASRIFFAVAVPVAWPLSASPAMRIMSQRMPASARKTPR